MPVQIAGCCRGPGARGNHQGFTRTDGVAVQAVCLAQGSHGGAVACGDDAQGFPGPDGMPVPVLKFLLGQAVNGGCDQFGLVFWHQQAVAGRNRVIQELQCRVEGQELGAVNFSMLDKFCRRDPLVGFQNFHLWGISNRVQQRGAQIGVMHDCTQCQQSGYIFTGFAWQLQVPVTARRAFHCIVFQCHLDTVETGVVGHQGIYPVPLQLCMQVTEMVKCCHRGCMDIVAAVIAAGALQVILPGRTVYELPQACSPCT